MINGCGPEASLLQAADGKLYGMTATGGIYDYGIIFQFDLQTASLIKKYDFDGISNGGNPQGSVIQAKNGKLYGLTSNGGKDDFGVLFEFDLSTSTFSKKLELTGQSDGGYPYGTLLEAADGDLYGLTSGGGANGSGVLFQYNIANDAYKVKFDFDDAVSGSSPQSSLVQANDGKLYGTTEFGGMHGDGVLFQYDPETSTYTKKFEFNDADNSTGKYAIGALIQATNGMIYGMGYNGGIDNAGVVFKFDLATSGFNKEFDFHLANNGSTPVGALTRGKDEMLYGVTQFGGMKNNGTLFKFDPTFGSYTKVYDFDLNVSGDAPTGSLLLAGDGKLYGTTAYGGTNDKGVLFQFDPVTAIYSVKKEFDGPSGSIPSGELIQTADGKIYGMTREGGVKGDGVLFQFDPVTSNFNKKIDFDDELRGSYPEGGLTVGDDGKLYGVTSAGGINVTADVPNGCGVLFQYDPLTNTYTKKIDFDGTANGSNPNGTLVKTADGKLYGMTTTGGINNTDDTRGYGVLFQYDPSSSTVSKKLDFDGKNNGANPNGSLLLASNGYLYGVTNAGGTKNMGVIFQFDPATFNYAKKMDFTQATGKFAEHVRLTEITVINSIADNQLKIDMNVFPNPAKDQLSLLLGKNVQNVTIKLLSITGQTVIEKTNLSGSKFTFNIEELSKGTYFVEILGNTTVSREKFVKE
ncbi:MAG TPA: choice-of-anchor tandem repeat GloVer-containing protein [Bacteroidia bacterium]|nr:choice-of-anchor tandem repeat GloVer-containing protein [Bacteroidia bacterium]